jgi:hypothetical protein
MKTPKHSLRKIVTFLNNTDEDGGFWLPNIQRPFVWTEQQICRLFDSILREYPISTLLVWKTRSTIRRRKFIDNYHEGIRLTDFYVPEDDKKKCLVLDGQQRLQSLYIGLCGSYQGRELYFDILSGEVAAPDDVKFKFAFMESAKAEFPWVRFKDLVFSKEDPLTAAETLIERANGAISTDERRKISRHVGIVFRTFHSDDGISYQELDSTENDALYTEDDVVEVFIRANSGGTRLGKSDLLFSLLSSTWDHADNEIEKLNRTGFQFNRDFILKTCLTLVGQGARYEVNKFRRPEVRKVIEDKWDSIADATKDVLDFVTGKTFIRCDKAIPSHLALIPLIFLRYTYPSAWRSARDLDLYLLRTLLAGAFGGTPDQLIDECVKKINELQGFNVAEIFGVIRTQGRSLELTADRFWDMGYGSDNVHLLFNLWYRDFQYSPAYENNMPQVDHVFPRSLLKKIKVANQDTGRKDVMKYRTAQQNQLANCALLTALENGSSGKTDTPPNEWFANKSKDYLAMHLIPDDPAIWAMDRFDDFLVARKALILQKFGYLLVQGS